MADNLLDLIPDPDQDYAPETTFASLFSTPEEQDDDFGVHTPINQPAPRLHYHVLWIGDPHPTIETSLSWILTDPDVSMYTECHNSAHLSSQED
jgi:hypothetical protein